MITGTEKYGPIEFHCESAESELLGKSFDTIEEAYEIYNLYALKIGFGTRKGRTRTKNNEIIGKEFVCCKQGFKINKGKQHKAYTRIDIRTGCEAMLYVEHTKDNGKWTIKEHSMMHNHQFMNPRECHRLRSHRKITSQDMDFLFTMKQSGIKVIEAVRVLKGINGGSPCVGFTSKDAYNAVMEKTRSMFDGPDAHCLIQIFQKRQASESDFFYDFELDDQCRLSSFFWWDGRMKEDYRLFHDVIIFDTTYKTNKYDIIYAPFIGINNHTQNVMFGCGFLTNERIESFNWLFQVFLKAMDQIQPQTVMTDQSASIASAIKDTFQGSAHRLCTWHLEENSRKHINHLRRKKDFVPKFQHCLRSCESEAEFEYYWNRYYKPYLFIM